MGLRRVVPVHLAIGDVTAQRTATSRRRLAHCQADGKSAAPWIEDVENYIRGALLWRPETHALAFRDEGQMVAVSAFYDRVVEVPAVQPVEHEAWHLDVLTVRLDKQGQHLSQEALQQSLGAMQELDASRVFVTSYVHQENAAALAVAAHFGLLPNVQHDPLYWTLLGELPP